MLPSMNTETTTTTDVRIPAIDAAAWPLFESGAFETATFALG